MRALATTSPPMAAVFDDSCTVIASTPGLTVTGSELQPLLAALSFASPL
jgi:hypothetical protein